MAKKPYVKVDSLGIQQLMKSPWMREELNDAANELQRKIRRIHKPDKPWRTEDSNRSDRAIVNLVNDDETLKWQEMADPKIAQKVGSVSRGGNRSLLKTEEANKKRAERDKKEAYWASAEGKAERKKKRLENKAKKEELQAYDDRIKEQEDKEGY